MTGCLGLHGPKYSCLECGTPTPPSVSDIYAWMRLEESVEILYRGDIAQWGHESAVERTANACGVSKRFVEKTLRKRKVIT